jgi:O-antigen/teichoic acid export membrane protein
LKVKIELVDLVIKVLKKFGVDKAIFYTSAARVIQAFTGVVTIFFVARFLSGVEQGFYYTFGSILAIQVFFELGLNGIITQYVAHEVSHLQWDSDDSLSGSAPHLSRLSSLLHLGVKWYSIIAGLLFIILLITGLVFFSRYDTSGGVVSWNIPWIILSFSTTLAFLVNPVLAFIEGLGKVKEVAKMRLLQQILTTFLIWICLVSGAKLYASGLSNIFGLLLLLNLLFFNKYRRIFVNIWKSLGKERIGYRSEIFPYQWKIALSWVSGFFIFQLFNPVLFATDGAVVAGQMGMTLAALNGILSLSFSWMSTKVPLYSSLIAQKKYDQLDNIFNRTLTQSVLINSSGLVFLFLAVYLLKYFQLPLGNRFLPYIPLLLMMAPIFLNQFVSSWATYLRCHKQEPMLVISIVGAIATSLSTIILGKYFGVLGITTGFCILTIIMFPWSHYIFKTKKILWHEDLPSRSGPVQ